MIYTGSILGPDGPQSLAFQHIKSRIWGWATDPDDADARRLPLRGAMQDGIIGFHVFEPSTRITYRGTVTEEGTTLVLEGDGSEAGQWAGEVVVTELPDDEVKALRVLAAQADYDDLEVPDRPDDEDDDDAEDDDAAPTPDPVESDDSRARRLERLRREEQERIQRERAAADRRQHKKEVAERARLDAMRAEAIKAKERKRAEREAKATHAPEPGAGIRGELLARLEARRRRMGLPDWVKSRRQGKVPRPPVSTDRTPTPSSGGGTPTGTGSLELRATGGRADQADMFSLSLSSPVLGNEWRTARFRGGRATIDSLPAGKYSATIDCKADIPWSPQPRTFSFDLGNGQAIRRDIQF